MRTPVEGHREGRDLMVELTSAEDPEGGGRYTVKRWHSEKVAAGGDEGGRRHSRIVLESLNPEIPCDRAEGWQWVAREFVVTL